MNATWQREGNDKCCSTGIEGFCGEGEGDCDRDSECAGSLVCGSNNCPWGPGDGDDCCTEPAAPPCNEDTGIEGGSVGAKTLQDDFKECQTHCKSTHPTATHFTYKKSRGAIQWTL